MPEILLALTPSSCEGAEADCGNEKPALVEVKGLTWASCPNPIF